MLIPTQKNSLVDIETSLVSKNWSKSIIPPINLDIYPTRLLNLFKKYGDTKEAYEYLDENKHLDYALIVCSFVKFEREVFEYVRDLIDGVLYHCDSIGMYTTHQQLLSHIVNETKDINFRTIRYDSKNNQTVYDGKVMRKIIIDELAGTYESKQELIDEFIKASKTPPKIKSSRRSNDEAT